VIILGVADLMSTARVVLGSDLANQPKWVAVYLTVGAIYSVVALLLSRLARHWERSQRNHSLVHLLARY